MTAGRRTAGDVYIVGNSASNPTVVGGSVNVIGSLSISGPVTVAGSVETRARAITVASADVTTSGGVVLLSVNTTGGQQFAITNRGSINIFIQGSYDAVYFQPSVNVYRQVGGGAYSAVECISASTIATFEGMFNVVRVVANSGSGVYRADLAYR